MNNVHSIKHNKSEFDWDDISVGDFDLDNSENYFGQKPAILAGDSVSEENKDGDSVSLYWNNSTRPPVHIKQETTSNLSSGPAGCAGVAVSPSCGGNTQSTFYVPQEKDNSMHLIANHTKEEKFVLNEINNTSSDSRESPSNLRCPSESNDDNLKPKLKMEWTPPSKVLKMEHEYDSVYTAAVPPRAYAYKDIYQNKREMAMRQREEEERKARQFQSRPVPDFKALHRRLEDVIVIHRITVPVTPETIKHSVADKERRKQKEDQKKLENDRKFLQEMNPFQLRSDQRVRDRQRYNALMQVNMEQKQLKLEEQRMKQELDEKKEIRKLTEFRARPNPFK